MYVFSKRSKERLRGVHPKLIAVAERALTYGVLDLNVVPYGGLRTREDQEDLVRRKVSWTMNSMHRAQGDGYGHAIDIAPCPVDWDNIERFLLMGSLLFRAAAEEGVILSWGGFWQKKDYPHFQLEEVL